MNQSTKPTTLRRPTIALLAGLAVVSLAFAVAAPARAAPSAIEVRATDDLVEQALAFAKRRSKPLPVWVVDTILLAAKTWKQFKNGEKVEQAFEKVTAVMKVIADIKADVDAGREMTDREFRRTFDLLDLHARGLKDLSDRIEKVEDDLATHQKKISQIEIKVGRPTCGVGMKRRNGRGPCVSAADDPL